ncbi:cell wall-binding repeat-containing protein [Desulfitobacterium chlororespirans]|uniref:Leucine rich repeat-containing protein n=1 Tax=Desulfitobacterium chlororespirans DSM 11544 TaxID=1121395 RepID=A0A1M7U923_9FIRM|nr:cell wall-binding repeat-containing protein [Desulfitobacterium chlororespirans]SHN79463.1 Leucine rich repeat-containing protein [Desulfitobacterium chlororespirans DSM 11544]
MLRWNKAAAFLVSLCLFTVLLIPGAEAATESSRLAGSDRYRTAVAASQEGWPTGSNAVVITTGENYPDALSAAPLAGKYDAPLLLTARSGLSPETINELKRLNPKNAYIVGGIGVIPVAVEKQIAGLGISVKRFSGQDRYDTALAVAREVGTSQGIFVTSGAAFADTLAVAPIAAAKGMPVLLVPKDELTPNLKSYLTRLRNTSMIIVGSENEVSKTIANQLPEAERIGGTDPYARNIALLRYFNDDIDPTIVYAATGEAFPDALSAAALAQKGGHPLVLLKGNQVPPAVQDYLSTKVINQVTVFGGTGVIPVSTESQLAGLPAEIDVVRNITVHVKEKETYELPKKVTVITSKGNQEEVQVDWNLDDVSTQKAGTYYYRGEIEGYYTTVELTLYVEPLLSKADTFAAEVVQGSEYSLPESVIVTLSDQTTKELPVTWSSSPTVSMLNKVGTYTFQGTVAGTDLKTKLTLKVSEDSAIKFKDSNLTWAVKFMLGKNSSSQPIYRSDVLSLTHLDAKGYGIRDLSGLENFTNLESLDLRNNFLEGAKLAPLQKLSNLKSLSLGYNDLEKINSLQNMTSLTYLDLGYNVIDDFSPLRKLTRLTRLYIKGNGTQDYSPTRGFYDQLADKDFDLDSVDYPKP